MWNVVILTSILTTHQAKQAPIPALLKVLICTPSLEYAAMSGASVKFPLFPQYVLLSHRFMTEETQAGTINGKTTLRMATGQQEKG